MSSRDIIRAWKDAEYRMSLSAAARAMLPGHPAGWMEPADAGVDRAGGHKGLRVQTAVKAGLLLAVTQLCEFEPAPVESCNPGALLGLASDDLL